MKLETLNRSLFAPLASTEAASILGGNAIAPVEGGGGGTFSDCYTFFKDNTYRTDDKDQD
jgi:hypothetical protein